MFEGVGLLLVQLGKVWYCVLLFSCYKVIVRIHEFQVNNLDFQDQRMLKRSCFFTSALQWKFYSNWVRRDEHFPQRADYHLYFLSSLFAINHKDNTNYVENMIHPSDGIKIPSWCRHKFSKYIMNSEEKY